MIVSLVYVIIIFAVFAMLWLESFWSNAITLMNVILAALLAMSFFEPVAAWIETLGAWALTYTYFWDYLSLWGLFAIFFGLLRLGTDFASRTRVKFKLPVEYAGRVICALGVGWMMVCMTSVGFHVAPLSTAPWNGSFADSPKSKTLFGIASPDRALLSFVQKVSRGSLATTRAATTDPSPYPDDGDTNVFDPNAEFLIKYRQRRQDLEEQPTLRYGIDPEQ
jgi:hypothetical protein